MFPNATSNGHAPIDRLTTVAERELMAELARLNNRVSELENSPNAYTGFVVAMIVFGSLAILFVASNWIAR